MFDSLSKSDFQVSLDMSVGLSVILCLVWLLVAKVVDGHGSLSFVPITSGTIIIIASSLTSSRKSLRNQN